MTDYAPFVLAMSIVLFVHMLPTFAAVVVPVWAGWRVLGPDKWACRRILAGWLTFGVIGYVVLFAYYAIAGIPPQASSIYNHSLHGAFFGAGYGGVAAFFYFRGHKSNPARPNKSVMPMCKDRCQEALGYWTIGLQYLHLVEAVIAETIAQRNAHIVVSDEEISWDQYGRDTRWSDHMLVIPVLFDFYHGIEVILKGFLVAAGAPPEKNHKLSQLVAAFEEQNPGHAIGATVRKYIAQDQLPEVLTSFCKTSGITIDDYYQALKYPQSTHGNVYKHYPLKYKGEEGVPFFEDLAKDIGEVVPKIVALGRSICPSA